MDPLTRGQIFHDVQFQLMQQLAATKSLPLTRENRGKSLELADRVLDQVAARYFDDLAPAIPRVWRNEIDDLRTDLRAWLIHVSEKSSEWMPIHFELAFGLNTESARDARSTGDPVALPNTGYLVRGSIDLVEKHTATGALRVTDHKTGGFPQKAPVHTGGGAILQPLLYSLAANELLAPAAVLTGRLYFCTRKGDYRDVQIRVSSEATETLETVMGTIDEALEQGFLPPYPKPETCDQCDYRVVCGPYELERTSRKRKDRVFPLQQLRGLP